MEALAGKAEIPVPKLYIIPADTPNAFATGRNEGHAAVAVTSGLLNLMNEAELQGVLAHELSHIKHKDILISTMAATIAGAVVLLSRWSVFFSGDEGGAVSAMAVAIVAPVAATLVQWLYRATRIRGRCRQRRHHRQSRSSGGRVEEIIGHGKNETNGSQSGNGAYVHCPSLSGSTI